MRITGRVTQTRTGEFDIGLTPVESDHLLAMEPEMRTEWIARRAVHDLAEWEAWQTGTTELEEHRILATESDFSED